MLDGELPPDVYNRGYGDISHWKGSDQMGTRPLGQALAAHVRRASDEHAQDEIPNISEETFGERVVIIENIANGDADAAERALQMN